MSNSRDHIIETAVQLFLQKSYHEVTMQDIVAATGLSKGAFYHYFSSKEKVFEEVINSYFSDSPNGDLSRFSQGSLWEFCQAYVRMVAERVKHYSSSTGDTSGILRGNQYVLIFDAMKLLPTFRENQQKLKERELQVWVSVIAQARKNGEIKSALDDSQIAKLFIYQSYGIGVYHVLRTQIEELTKEVSLQFKAIYDTLV